MYRQPPRRRQSRPANRRGSGLTWLVLTMAVCGIGLYLFRSNYQTRRSSNAMTTMQAPAASTKPSRAAAPCGLQESRYVIVSISQRHLWACSRSTVEYESAVVTGQQNVAATATPIGTFHVASKQSERWLTGSDTRSRWAVYVHYWIPFVHNQYGNDGFHDATWRKPSEFGTIDPDSAQASHGCVELPLVTAKWLFGWVAVGTTVVVRS